MGESVTETNPQDRENGEDVGRRSVEIDKIGKTMFPG